ncbi:hypothetical protein KI809_00530 [Geobacter pelophilus]|uniref:Carboxypeptidase regulatory-like domain-containing protein n=1 Tax=Geoanaerobacter pelophilus TaxID=60036 RepID=A0AAW4KW47_9BACT|nr:hypothetical protein [Geoanaerobacter pelophilus]MBT0662776.1 hypothetical protein [Geoanaerobacter pelophilus]
MKSLVKAGLLIISVLTLLVACGGGGGGSTPGPVTQLSGVASKGLVSGGTVRAYKIVGEAVTTQIGSDATTAADGTYSINIGDYTGPLMVQVTGGTYVDESTGLPTQLNIQTQNGLRAYVANATSGTPLTAAVTPLTELAVQYLGTGALSPANITAANSKISNLYGVADIVTSSPTSGTYQSTLSAISSMSTGASTPVTVGDLLASMKTQIPVNQDPLPVTVGITKDKASAIANGSDIVTLTASVLPVKPAGTPVVFAITSGIATFEDGSTTYNTTMNAPTAKIKSATLGSVTVTATCAAVSASTTITFGGAPVITLSVDKSSAVASGTDIINLSVTSTTNLPVGTDVTFSIVSGNAVFGNLATTYATKILASPANTAQATILSSVNGDVVVKADCQGSSDTKTVTFGNGLASYASLKEALGPVFVIASDASIPTGTIVNFTATGAGTIRVFDGNWSKTGAYGTSAAPSVAAAGTFAGKAAVYLRCNSAGDVTITATRQGSSTPIGTVTKTCYVQTSSQNVNVSLTPAGAAKLGSNTVTKLWFNIVAAPGTSTSAIASYGSAVAVEQKNAVTTFVNLAPNTALTSSTPIFTATYAYNPSPATFTVMPIGSVTLSGGSTVTLTSSDFVVQ